MGNETRRLLVAMLAAMAVFIAYQLIVVRFLPAPAPPQPAPQGTPGPNAVAPTDTRPGPQTGPTTTQGETLSPTPRQAYSFSSGDTLERVMLGGREGDALRMELHPRGGALATLQLYAKDDKGRFRHRVAPATNEPYQMLFPVTNAGREHFSFATQRVRIDELDQAWQLDALPWEIGDRSATRVQFHTTLRDAGGEELLRLTKTYTLEHGKPIVDIELVAEVRGTRPLTIRLEQDGPTGIHEDVVQTDMRRLVAAQYEDGSVRLRKAWSLEELRKATLKGEPQRLITLDDGPLLWTALVNKYFGVYTRPLAVEGQFQNYVVDAQGLVAAPELQDGSDAAKGDLVSRLVLKAVQLQPGQSARFPLQIYAGPKDVENLRAVNPEFADYTKLYYQVTQTVGTCSCWCNFLWLQELMVWLLHRIHYLVRNYGVAIIVLVIIIRSLLHPLAVWQQRNMFRMQENMAKIQPRVEAIREKFPNDKARQNQEMMRVWSEEGINPMAQFSAFLPIMLQMPILIALWSALSTDVHLRHAPFDGWWIRDLAAPDALISWPPVYVPLLSWIMGPISSLNLLPILMGLSMWLQQKYMPKPAHAQRPAAAAKPAAKTPGRLSPEDQLRQQQMMANMMAVLFPLMFYSMPSGLTLYWMATNVFGIFESLRIRKQIEAEKKRRDLEGPRPPKPPGPLGRLSKWIFRRFFGRVVEQFEELQRKADELSREPGKGKKKP